MHEAGIIHRDLKPGNVLITESKSKAVPLKFGRRKAQQPPLVAVDLRVCITDFGLSRKRSLEITDDNEDTRSNGDLCGTPGYVDPAVLKGASDYSPQSDLFGLGCLLYNVLTGGTSPIFSGANSQQTLLNNEILDPTKLINESLQL